MTDIIPFLLSMLEKPGLSGYEEPVRDLIAEKWRPLVDEVSVSPMGSLHGLRRASAKENRPSLMIATHMDAIGLIVKQVEDELLTITAIGGVDPRVLPGQWVTVHGRKEIPGVVQLLPNRLLEDKQSGKVPEFKTLFVDTGLPAKDLKQQVKPGDLISFAQPPFEIEGGYIAGHSLDNRVSIAALTACFEELKNFNLAWNVIGVATTQEEITFAGATTSAFGLHPDLAITVDVTFAKGPGSNGYRTFPLGKGPTIGVGSNIHPALVKKFTRLAEEMDMPYAIETMPASSGTDSVAIQITADGIPNEVLGIPLRYMHTSVEMVALNDVLRIGRLLARFITGLTPDSLNSLLEENPS